MPPYQCPQCGQYTVSRSDTRPAEAERVRGKRIVGPAKRANGLLCETRFTQRACEKCGWSLTPSAIDLLALRQEARAGRVMLLAACAASP